MDYIMIEMCYTDKGFREEYYVDVDFRGVASPCD